MTLVRLLKQVNLNSPFNHGKNVACPFILENVNGFLVFCKYADCPFNNGKHVFSFLNLGGKYDDNRGTVILSDP